ncbi:MAG: NUDIX hydrolase [Candidatus Aenigmatarchaeota archaeon]|nr:NUDIX hydrolase [Candidatus Aenigmarchaeota archaeon]
MRFETSKGFISIFVSGAVIKDKKVLLLHRKDPDVWEFPSGNIEYDEHPSETAKREVKEETNLDVLVEKLLAIGSTIRPDKEHEIVLSFLCRPRSSKVTLGEEDHSEYKWFTLGEIKKIKNLATSVQSVLKELSSYL